MTPERLKKLKAGLLWKRSKGQRRWKWLMDKQTYLKKKYGGYSWTVVQTRL